MDNTHLIHEPSLNPEFLAMLVKELIAHINRHCHTANFADMALVFTMHEHRLTEVEELVHVGDEHMDMQ